MKKLIYLLIFLFFAQNGFAQGLDPDAESVIWKKIQEEEAKMKREREKQQDEQRRHERAQANTQREIAENQQAGEILWNNYKAEDYTTNPTQNQDYRAFTNQNDKIQQENRVAALEGRNTENNNKQEYEEERDFSQAWETMRWGKIDETQRGESFKEHADKEWEKFKQKAPKEFCLNYPQNSKCVGNSRRLPAKLGTGPHRNTASHDENSSATKQATSAQARDGRDKMTKPGRTMAKDKKGQPQQIMPRSTEPISPRKAMSPKETEVRYAYNGKQPVSTSNGRSNGGSIFPSPEQVGKTSSQQGNKTAANNKNRNGNGNGNTNRNKNGNMNGNGSRDVGKTVAASSNAGQGQNGNKQGAGTNKMITQGTPKQKNQYDDPQKNKDQTPQDHPQEKPKTNPTTNGTTPPIKLDFPTEQNKKSGNSDLMRQQKGNMATIMNDGLIRGGYKNGEFDVYTEVREIAPKSKAAMQSQGHVKTSK